MAARMKDIAMALGISIVTVSKVLNGDPTISETTRKRVLDCAKQLKYRTNLAAKGLVTGQSLMVGLIVPELFHGFFAEIAASLSQVLRDHGYGLIISSSRDDGELEREELLQMMSRNVDALVVASCELQSDTLEALAAEIPVVLLDRRVALGVKCTFVGSDDFAVGEIATQHLLDVGCRRLAYIGGADLSPTIGRKAGFHAALRQRGLQPAKNFLVRLPQNEEATDILAAECMRQMLREQLLPDGVFCYNDPAAHGVMQAIAEAGLRIPEDIAVIGCGNNRYDAWLRVPLTSVDQDAHRLGLEAARTALSLVGESRMRSVSLQQEIVLQPTLIKRESTRRVPVVR